MTIEDKAQASSARRRCRLGMVGGGQGAFIGAVHRIAARLDDRFELVAGALSSDSDRAKASAVELGIDPDRAYGAFAEMAKAEAARADGIDVVAIVTPNHMHHGPAKAFLDAGIHVICDKPLCTSLGEARELVEAVDKSKKIFALTHNYTGYPMVRQMREMIAAGVLGDIRVVQVEYAQDWLSTKLEASGQKQASWRTDPTRSGAGGCIGDIGTHAYNLAAFTTGLKLHSLCADMQSFVEGRRLDDNCHLLLRYEGGARGMLWSSQVSPGNENGLKIRIYGAKAGLSWRQEHPNHLDFTPLGEPPRLITRGGAGSGDSAGRVTRIPPGHPEGYLEGFSNIYADVAELISARAAGRDPDPDALLVPTVRDGFDGMAFITAAVESSHRGGVWVEPERLACT
ncbi:MAG: Gfo/Idh/MocA family oxidoreductase [Alphaproteobacteria bacterium]|nr:Gfo/Idh/MocA family oxidoreductase [Alphaproteobacteria bacterium]